MESKIYQAPEADVGLSHESTEYSIERGLSGDFPFSVRAILSEAWDKTKGAKFSIHLGSVLAFGIYFGAFILVVFGVLAIVGTDELAGESTSLTASLFELIANIGLTALGGPLFAGFYMMGIRRAADAEISATSVVGYFHKTLPLLGLQLLMGVIIVLGFLLLIIPGIYLSFALMFALPLCAEKNLGVVESLSISRRVISKRWFRFVGLVIVLGLINMLAMIPVGIGLIWSVPMSVIAMGIAYRNMFGVSQSA